jgi:hypothetical protein
MSYFIFLPNLDNINGSLYRIAENEYDLNSLNLSHSIYKIIETNQTDFDDVKYGVKCIEKYNDNTVFFINENFSFVNKITLQNYINNFKTLINSFLQNNPNSVVFDRWNNYLNQLSSLNLDNITYPLNKSLEQYFIDLGQPSLNPLQLP